MASSIPPPKVQFADALKAATKISPAIPEFVDILTEVGPGMKERLSRVAGVAYKFGGLDDRRQAELVRVWMLHDPAACHGFVVREEQLRSAKRMRELEKENRAKGEAMEELKRKVSRLESELYLKTQIKQQEERGAANGLSSQAESGAAADEQETQPVHGE
jgi:hypothetical protein